MTCFCPVKGMPLIGQLWEVCCTESIDEVEDSKEVYLLLQILDCWN